MNIKKKALYSIGVLGMVAAPVATVISCGNACIDTSLFKWDTVVVPPEAYVGTNGAGSIDVTKVTGISEHLEISYKKQGESDINPQTLSGGDEITLTLLPEAGYNFSEPVPDYEYTISNDAFTEKEIDTSNFQWSPALPPDAYVGTPGAGSIDLTKVPGIPEHSVSTYTKAGGTGDINPQTLSGGDEITLTLAPETGYTFSEPVLDQNYTIPTDAFVDKEIDTSNFQWSPALPPDAYVGTPGAGHIDLTKVPGIPEHSVSTYTKAGGTGDINPQTLSGGDEIILTLAPETGYTFSEPVPDHEYTIPNDAFTDKEIDTSNFQWSPALPPDAYVGTPGAGHIDLTKVPGIPEHSVSTYTKAGGTGDINPQTLSGGDEITLTLAPETGYTFSEPVLDQNYTIPTDAFTEKEIDTSNFRWPPALPPDVYVGTPGTGSIDLTILQPVIPEHSVLTYTKIGETTLNPTNLSDGDQIALKLAPEAGYTFSDPVPDQDYTIPTDAFGETIDMAGWEWPALATQINPTNGTYTETEMRNFLGLGDPKYDNVVISHKINQAADWTEGNLTGLVNRDKVAFKLSAQPGYKLGLDPGVSTSSGVYTVTIT